MPIARIWSNALSGGAPETLAACHFAGLIEGGDCLAAVALVVER